MTDFKKLKVVELRAELASRNLPQTGKRDELIERLEEYEFHHAMPTDNEPVVDETVATESVVVEEVHSTISPILPPSPILKSEPTQSATLTAEEIEEEKRRQRALRFGLDPNPPVKIEVTIKRLEHALPNRPHHHHRHKHRRHKGHHKSFSHRQVSINKP